MSKQRKKIVVEFPNPWGVNALIKINPVKQKMPEQNLTISTLRPLPV